MLTGFMDMLKNDGKWNGFEEVNMQVVEAALVEQKERVMASLDAQVEALETKVKETEGSVEQAAHKQNAERAIHFRNGALSFATNMLLTIKAGTMQHTQAAIAGAPAELLAEIEPKANQARENMLREQAIAIKKRDAKNGEDTAK